MLPYLLLVVLPTLVLSGLAALYVKVTFAKYEAVPAASRMTGAEAARYMLEASGVRGVRIEETDGFLGDHYDPSCRTLRLSESVYHGQSLSAIGVACHEAGHALQHAQAYAWLEMRSFMAPAVQVCGFLYGLVIFAGALLHAAGLIWLGVLLFAVTVFFAVITLPVEWDASRRAKEAMTAHRMLAPGDEADGAAAVLNAAFLTYVAAAVGAILHLLYYLWRLGVIGPRRD